MPESQEAQAIHPYKTLELHPHAPRDLIVAAYWALITRAKQGRTVSAAAGARIGELNAAYRLLADDDARSAYDRQQGLAATRRPEIRAAAKGIRLFGIGAPVRMVSDHNDFYHLLRIDREAGDDVIDAAFAVMSGQAVDRDAGGVFLRGLLEEARHTLRNPQLRAQYDASLGARAPKQTPPETIARPASVPAATHQLPPTTDRTPPAMPCKEEAAASTNGNGTHAVTPMSAREGRGGAPEPAAGEPRRQTVPPMFAKSGEGVSRETAAAPVVAAEAPGPHGIFHRLRMPSRGSRAESGPPTARDVQPATHALPGVSARKIAEPEEIIEAEHARLMTLREDRALSSDAAAPATGAAPAAIILAELVFLEGPRAGERVPLGAEAVNLGSSYSSHVVLTGDEEHIAPEHARIWRHGDHFVFRQLDEGETTIAGERLALPMVVLDDGDEIRISVHRMRLEHTPRG